MHRQDSPAQPSPTVEQPQISDQDQHPSRAGSFSFFFPFFLFWVKSGSVTRAGGAGETSSTLSGDVSIL